MLSTYLNDLTFILSNSVESCIREFFVIHDICILYTRKKCDYHCIVTCDNKEVFHIWNESIINCKILVIEICFKIDWKYRINIRPKSGYFILSKILRNSTKIRWNDISYYIILFTRISCNTNYSINKIFKEIKLTKQMSWSNINNILPINKWINPVSRIRFWF